MQTLVYEIKKRTFFTGILTSQPIQTINESIKKITQYSSFSNNNKIQPPIKSISKPNQMKSIMKSIISPNWCCQDNRIIRNRSEKQLAFDVRSKSFCIVDIKEIRKGYKEKTKIQERKKQMREEWIEVNMKDKTMEDRRKSLLSVHCQKLRRQRQNQHQIQQPNQVEYLKPEIRKQKIRMTCAKNDEYKLFRETNQKVSNSYLRINKEKKNIHQFHAQEDHSTQNIKRFSLSIKPNIDFTQYQQLANYPQSIIKNRSLTPSNTTLKKFSSTPSASMSRPKLNNFVPQEKQESICTTVENSQNYSVNNLVDQSKYVESQIVELKENCEIEENKQNDMNVGNRRRDQNQKKSKRTAFHEQDEKITQSILIEQNEQSYRQRNQEQINQHQQKVSNLTNQLNHLHDQFNQLKLQESSLLLKLNSDQHQFHQKYQQLLEKKFHCEINDRQRRDEINQIKSLLNQRFTNQNQHQ